VLSDYIQDNSKSYERLCVNFRWVGLMGIFFDAGSSVILSEIGRKLRLGCVRQLAVPFTGGVWELRSMSEQKFGPFLRATAVPAGTAESAC